MKKRKKYECKYNNDYTYKHYCRNKLITKLINKNDISF